MKANGGGIAPPNNDAHAELRKIHNFLACAGSELPDQQVDVIFVFGHWHPGPAFWAAELYKRGLAKRIVVSGGVGPKTRPRLADTHASEAAYFFDILTHQGVPGIPIILETEATNTLENVQLGIAKYKERSGRLPDSAILVAIPALLRRSQATMSKQWPSIKTYTSEFALPPPFNNWPLEEIYPLLRAEVEKLEAYSAKGDIVPVPIPDEVRTCLTMLDAFWHGVKTEH